MKIGVIDYGVGNTASIMHVLEKLSANPVLIDKISDLHNTDAFVLPGVGNFTSCMQLLNAGGWTEELQDQVLAKEKPFLGICLGMQLLASFSMEGAENSDGMGTKGLGFIDGKVISLREQGCTKRIPHVGWNELKKQNDCVLLRGIPTGTDFYFTHSYGFIADNDQDVAATTDYCVPITAVVSRKSIWGTQFHPEKSSGAGFKLLKNFVEEAIC